MRIAPSLVLILSLAACEHASNATSPSTLPELEEGINAKRLSVLCAEYDLATGKVDFFEGASAIP